MAAGQGTVTVKILGDASSLKGALSESDSALGRFHDKASAVGGKMMSVGSKLTLGLTTPILGVGALAFDAASDLNESMSKVNVVFGDNADKIKAWSESAATSMGMSKQAALEAAGTFGNFLQSMGLAQQPATDMSQSLVGLASDLASFNNANPEDVLLALRSGLSGEAEPMRKYGVALSETAVKAKALEMGLGDAHGELTEGEKIQARYAIVMDQTKMAQGDFARTADGAANKQRILKAEFQDLAANIGNKLMPIGQKLLEWVGKLADWWGKLDPQMQNIVLIVAAVAAAIGPVVGVIGALVTAIAAVVSPVGLVVIAIAALVAGLVYAYTHFEGFRKVVDNVASFLVEKVWPALKTMFDLWLTAWKLLFTGIVAAWDSVGHPLFDAIVTVVQTLVDWFKTAWPAIQAVFQTVFDIISDYWTNVAQPIFWLIISVAQKVIDWFQTTWSAIGDAFSVVWDVAKTAWDTVGKPIFDAILTAIDKLIGPLETVIGYMQDVAGFLGLGDTIDVEGLKREAEAKYRREHSPPPGAAGQPYRSARGNPNFPGGWSWVGEEGPELVRVPGGSAIFPHDKSMAMAGGGVQNFYISSTEPVAAAHEIAQYQRAEQFLGR